MSVALQQDQAENVVLHFLAYSHEAKSAREIQEALDLNMVQVTRALNTAKNQKPAQVSLESGKYRFIGRTDALEALPDEFSHLSVNASSLSESSSDEDKSYDPIKSTQGHDLGPTDHQVLELLTAKKKVPLSGLIRQFKLEEDKAVSILDSLESKGLLVKEHIDDFDEDCFSISAEGLDVVERYFAEPKAPSKAVESNVYSIKKPSSKEDTKESEKTIDAPKEAVMTSEMRKFNLPDYDNIPEENASGRGRPTGDRDYEYLRVSILGYIDKYGTCAKSNISRKLANELTSFGRQTIAEEVDDLVALGYVHAHMSGKREVFTLTEAGADIVSKVKASQAIGSIGQASEPASAPKASKPKAAKPAAAPKPVAAAKPKPAPEPAHAPAASAPSSAPSAPSSAPSMAGEDHLGTKVQTLLSSVPGETGYQLRYCFDQLLERVTHLEKSNQRLKAMTQELLDDI